MNAPSLVPAPPAIVAHAPPASLRGLPAGSLRLSELVGALSYALDMTEGQPAGHSLRCRWIGMAIADAAGLAPDQRAAMPAAKAFAIMDGDAGTALDPECLAALRRVMARLEA